MANNNNKTCNREEIVIVGALRTPIGELNGELSTVRPWELGGQVLKRLIEQTKVIPDELIIGQSLTALQGLNPARQTALAAGCPVTTTATTIDQHCGSGLKACILGAQALRCGDVRVVCCGGQENMSQAPHCVRIREPHRLNDATLADSLVHDGCTDTSLRMQMGCTAEHVAKLHGITRDQQDRCALESHRKHQKALDRNALNNEIVPIKVRKGHTDTRELCRDEHPRADADLEALCKLKTHFQKECDGGTVTAGNSSGLGDGAALLMLTTHREAREMKLKPLARIVAWAEHGCEPVLMGMAPVEAIRKAVTKAEWRLEDVDLIELNEAFGATILAVVKELNLDEKRVNVNGGALALGDPIGCSGARTLVSLVHELHENGKRRGVAALCMGGGMGIAVCIERID